MSLESNRAQILNDHNEYRVKHRAQPLSLDDTLNEPAQQYAEQLAAEDSGLNHSGIEYGENLYQGTDNPTDATRAWYDEIAQYDFGSGGYSPATGHFTALVWCGSTGLGVGIAQAGSGRTYVVAHYNPAGNMAGQFEENVFPPGDGAPPTPASNNEVTNDSDGFNGNNGFPGFPGLNGMPGFNQFTEGMANFVQMQGDCMDDGGQMEMMAKFMNDAQSNMSNMMSFCSDE